MKTKRKCDVSYYQLLLTQPTLWQQDRPSTTIPEWNIFILVIIWEEKTFCNQNVGDGKCERRWLWGGVASSHWLATLLLLPVWVNYIFYSPSHLQHSTKNNSLNANQIMEDMWHIDALGDRVVRQPSTPFDLRIILYYGDSCGYGAVHWIPDTLRNRGTLSMSTFNLFCKQFIIEIKLGLLLVGAEGRGKKAQIRGNVTKDFKLIFLTYD